MNILEITVNSNLEFIHRHVNALHEYGLPVRILTTPRPAHAETIPVEYKPLPKFAFLSPLGTISFLRKLPSCKNLSGVNTVFCDQVALEYIQRLKPDLIHFHFGNLAESLAWISRELGIPYSLSLRGSDIQVAPLLDHNRKRSLAEVLNHASGIHTVCDHLWDLAQPYLTHPIHHQSIYTTLPLSDRPIDQRKQPTQFQFISVGRLHWRKNYPDLVKAFKNLLESGLDASLTLVGEGPERESLQYWINHLGLQERVSLTGRLSPAQVRELLISSDAYIQSSIAEGFSNATAEAMALGLPVFATAVGGTAELIRDGRNGFLLEPLDSRSLSTTFLKVTDRELMVRIGQNAWKTAQEYFNPELHAREFREFFDQVLASHHH